MHAAVQWCGVLIQNRVVSVSPNMLMFRCLKSSPIFRSKPMNITALKHGAVAVDVGEVQQKLLNI